MRYGDRPPIRCGRATTRRCARTHWLEAIAGAPLVLAEIEERHDARTEGENPLADLRRKAEDGNEEALHKKVDNSLAIPRELVQFSRVC